MKELADSLLGGSGIILYIILIIISLLFIVLYGFLWNYHVIQELRILNQNIENLNDVLGSNLKNISRSINTNKKENRNETTN